MGAAAPEQADSRAAVAAAQSTSEPRHRRPVRRIWVVELMTLLLIGLGGGLWSWWKFGGGPAFVRQCPRGDAEDVLTRGGERGLQSAGADGVALYRSDADRGVGNGNLVQPGSHELGEGLPAGTAGVTAEQHQLGIDHGDQPGHPTRDAARE